MLALIDLRSQDLRGHNRSPRPASPGSTTKVETVHPLLSCAASTVCSAVLDRTRTTRGSQLGFPVGVPPPWSGRRRGCGDGKASGARARMKRPLRALAVAETRPQGPDRQGRSRSCGRVSPEMRPGPLTLTGPQPPERTPVTANDAREQRHGCLFSATLSYKLVTKNY